MLGGPALLGASALPRVHVINALVVLPSVWGRRCVPRQHRFGRPLRSGVGHLACIPGTAALMGGGVTLIAWGYQHGGRPADFNWTLPTKPRTWRSSLQAFSCFAVRQVARGSIC